MSTTPVVLIDVSNLLHRSHFAFKGLSHEGQPTGATHGFLKAVLALREQISKRLVFVWDYGIPVDLRETMMYVPARYASSNVILTPPPAAPVNWRLKVLPTYKSSRKYSEETRIAQSQMPGIHRVIHWMGYSSIGFPGLEADDVIGVLAGKYAGENLIFSSDRDLYQLLTPDNRVRVLKPGKGASGQWRYMGAGDVLKEYGVSVAQWPAYLALGGDSSDDIKPVRGMGPVTAKKLIKPFMLDELPPKYRMHRDAFHKAYQAALLPRSWDDPRIAPYGPFPEAPRSIQHFKDRTASAEVIHKFSVFCADRGLAELYGQRKSFFTL